MKKIKLLIASLVGAVALVFSCVLGTNIKAAENENSYFYSTKTIAGSNASWGTTAEGTQLGNSIFSVICTVSGKVEYKKVGSDYHDIVSDYMSGLSITTASSSESTADKCIKVTCPESGKLKILAYSKDADRIITLYGSDYTVHSSNQSIALDNLNPRYIYFDIEEAGTYYLCHNKSVGYFHLEFIDTAALNSSVTALQQESVDLVEGTYRLIRFIFIIDGKCLDSEYVKSRFYLHADKGTNTETSVNKLPKAVGRITYQYEDYTALVNGVEYTFSKKSNVTYVVYTVKFTQSKYSGRSINASLYFKGETFETTPYTFE